MFSSRTHSPVLDSSSPPSSPSPFAVDSSPPSSPALEPVEEDDDKPLVHPFAASTKAVKTPPRYEKRSRARSSFADEFNLEPTSKKARMSLLPAQAHDFSWDDGLPAISFGEPTEEEVWDQVIAEVIDHGIGTVRLEEKNLTYISEYALQDLQGFRALPEKAELLNARTIFSPIQPASGRRQFSRVSTAPASTSGDLFPSFTERTSSASHLGLPREEIQLFLSRNNIRFLPSLLFQIENLTVLSLRANRVTYLPPEVSKLSNLRELNVANNKLRYLPSEILHLNLTQLSINPNPFISPPDELTTPTSRRTFSRFRSLVAGRATIARRELEANDQMRIVSPVTQTLPDIIPLVELCLRSFASPYRPSESTSTADKSVLSSAYQLPLTDSQCQLRASSPLGKFPTHLGEILATLHPGSISAEDLQDRRLTAEDDDVRITGVGTCPSPRHSKEPGSSAGPGIFVRHAEERFTWVHSINGIKLGGLIPLRWRGCQHGCLNFLENDADIHGNSTTATASPSTLSTASDLDSVVGEAAVERTTIGDVMDDAAMQAIDAETADDDAVVAVNFDGALDMDFEE